MGFLAILIKEILGFRTVKCLEAETHWDVPLSCCKAACLRGTWSCKSLGMIQEILSSPRGFPGSQGWVMWYQITEVMLQVQSSVCLQVNSGSLTHPSSALWAQTKSQLSLFVVVGKSSLSQAPPSAQNRAEFRRKWTSVKITGCNYCLPFSRLKEFKASHSGRDSNAGDSWRWIPLTLRCLPWLIPPPCIHNNVDYFPSMGLSCLTLQG